jgi:pyruvate/2-oxoglutarate dehydrogenase complex dihydrolipoamide dehydrogenase (E3) component
MTIDADVIVVGLGVGGEFVAGRLAEAGLGVVGIESALVGGECPYWGCVPSKMIIRAANTLAEARRVGKLGPPAVRCSVRSRSRSTLGSRSPC